MRIQHVAQAAKGWPDFTPIECDEGARLADFVEHIAHQMSHAGAERAHRQ